MARPLKNAGALCAALSLALAACGAGDKNADNVDPNPPQCLTVPQIAPRFLELLREGRFEGLREVLEGELGAPLDAANPNGPTRLSALLGIVLEVIREVDVPGFKQVLQDAVRATSGGPLLPQALGLLRYVDGRLGCPTGTSCDHYDFLDVLRRLLLSGECTEAPANFDARTELDLLARLVDHPRLPELIDLMPRLLRNPTFEQAIDSFRFEGCNTPPCEQENGFAALMDILLDNVLVSPLPWNDIRDLLRQVRLDTPEVLALIDLAQDLLAEPPARPDSDVLGPLRIAIRCLRQVDPGRALFRNVWRVLSLDEVSLDGLLGGVDRILDADPQRLTLRLLSQALAYFRSRGLSSFRTLQRVGDVMLSTANLKKIVPVLIEIVEADVAQELVDLLIALTGECASVGPPS